MGDTYKLAAKKRTMSKNSARDTRDENRIPAVVYGHGFEPQAISVDYSEFLRTFRKAGQASLLNMDLDGTPTKVVVQSYDLDPVQDTFRHIDFFAVNVKEAMTVHVPLNFVGESPAIKTFGGMFMKSHDAIDIRCLPGDIPHDIEVDLGMITELGQHITIADLNLSDKFELMHYEETEMLCSVVAPKKVEEEIPDAAPEAAEVPSDNGSEDNAGE